MPGEVFQRSRLDQNYPNPFNPATTIKYSLRESGYVELKVYNTAGMEVASLINGKQQAGTYEVQFEASGLTSGVYFYTLKAGSFTQTRKMSLIK